MPVGGLGSGANPERRLRLLLDANVFISDLISMKGPAEPVIEACLDGRFVLLYSQGLLDELESVFVREKFRRWFPVEEGYVLLDVIRAAGERVEDRPESEHPKVCVDPDDNYLFSVYEDGRADVLVSGDKGVRAVQFPGCAILNPTEALGLLEKRHSWGSHLIKGSEEEAVASMAAEGNGDLLKVVSMFSAALTGIREGKYHREIVTKLVAPGTEAVWLMDLDEVIELVRDRAIATKPWVMGVDVCAMKLVPDLGDTYRSITPTRELADVVWVTLVRYGSVLDGEGNDPLNVGGWRPHSIGDYPVDPSQIQLDRQE